MESPASGAWSKMLGCTWPTAGAPAWASIKTFLTIPPSRYAAMREGLVALVAKCDTGGKRPCPIIHV